MNQYSDDNGCTCKFGQADSWDLHRLPSAIHGGIGLMPGNNDETKNRQCSNCYWNER